MSNNIINKIVFKNNHINPNINVSNSNTKRNDINLIKESKSNIMVKNFTTKDKEKEEINSKKTEKEKLSENTYTNRNNNNSVNGIGNNINTKIIIKNDINQKIKKEIDSKAINITPAKVINNTTNINIINYNCYNNATNRNSNLQLQKKIIDISQNPKGQFKSFTNNDLIDNNLANLNNINKSKEITNNNNLTLFNGNESFYGNKNNFTLKKKVNNNFTKSMINFNNIKVNKFNLVNKNSKKSTSVKRIDYENNINNGMDLSQKLPQTINVISLSQGKAEKKKNNKDKDKNNIKQANNTFYNFSLNVIQNNNNANAIINSNNSGNSYKGSNTSNNFVSLLTKAYSTNGFKSFYSNKDDKYNYKLNTNYIKEENKKYMYNNSFNDKNIIDEKDELDISNSNSNIYDYNQKSYSKKKTKKKLLIPFGSENLDIYNKNSIGYGTFYKKNFLFGFKKKDKIKKYLNNNKLPKLYKSISNATQYNYFGSNKIKKNNSNIYMIGKKGFNPYNYDYTSKFKYYAP